MRENQSMYNHNKAQQSKNRVHISWDILYHALHHLYVLWNQLRHTIPCRTSWTIDQNGYPTYQHLGQNKMVGQFLDAFSTLFLCMKTLVLRFKFNGLGYILKESKHCSCNYLTPNRRQGIASDKYVPVFHVYMWHLATGSQVFFSRQDEWMSTQWWHGPFPDSLSERSHREIANIFPRSHELLAETETRSSCAPLRHEKVIPVDSLILECISCSKKTFSPSPMIWQGITQ